MDLNKFFIAVEQWATRHADVRAVALIDGDADVESRANLALLVITADPSTYARDPSWSVDFGTIVDVESRAVSARTRIAHREGASIDFVFAKPSWIYDERGWRSPKGGIVPIVDRYGEIAAWHKALETNDPVPPPRADITYAEWLALSSAERDEVVATWNPYQHDNIHIPQESARRFLEQCKYPCAGVDVGVYHMGVYVLSARLYAEQMSPAEISALPQWLAFEGFSARYIRATK